MPHIVSQMVSEEQSYDALRRREAAIIYKRSTEFERSLPSPTSQRTGTALRPLPSLSLLSMPESKRWDFGSIRHIRQPSDECTPTSETETVFELPSGGSRDTLSSWTNSLFIAELEDTSPIVPSKLPPTYDPINTKVTPLQTSVSSDLLLKSQGDSQKEWHQLSSYTVTCCINHKEHHCYSG